MAQKQIEAKIAKLEPEWQVEYQRLGNYYANIAAWMIILTYPLGIFADINFIKPEMLLTFLAIQIFPSFVIAIALIIRRLYFYRHEFLVLVMAFSLFLSATHKVSGEDLVYYLINNALCFVASSVLMIVSPLYPIIILIYVIVINVAVQYFVYDYNLLMYFAREGGIIVSVSGLIFVLVTRFRYQILRTNFLNSLALKESYELLAQQNKIIEEKSEIIQEINKDITDSINYAKRIQQAIFQFEEEMNEVLPEHFVFLKPRDIVSGDFYWFSKVQTQNPDNQIITKLIITAVDCTGHGVPGAFMSMLAGEALSNLVETLEITEADKILNELNREIRRLLKQKETGNHDGMDMALCVIDLDTQVMEFAGARNPLVYIQNNELVSIKGDKMPVGGYQHVNDAFTKHCIDINVPTTIYLFSDGYQDQFGGAKGKKFMVKKLQELLLEIHQKPMAEQKQILETAFENWQNESNQKQVDDVLVVGIRLPALKQL